MRWGNDVVPSQLSAYFIHRKWQKSHYQAYKRKVNGLIYNFSLTSELDPHLAENWTQRRTWCSLTRPYICPDYVARVNLLGCVFGRPGCLGCSWHDVIHWLLVTTVKYLKYLRGESSSWFKIVSSLVRQWSVYNSNFLMGGTRLLMALFWQV